MHQKQLAWTINPLNTVYFKAPFVFVCCVSCLTTRKGNSATLSTWCTSIRWLAGRTMTWCSIQSFLGFSPTTSRRYITCTQPPYWWRVSNSDLVVFVPARPWTCPTPTLSATCPSQWELRRSEGGRCSSRDTKKLRTRRGKVLVHVLVPSVRARLCPSAVNPASLLPCRGLGCTVPLLHALLVRHHRRLLPGQDGALLAHLPDAAGRGVMRSVSCVKFRIIL